MHRVLTICALAVMLSGCTQKAEDRNLAAGSCSKAQSESVENHISGQINALSKEDWELAFSFASASFQKNIGLDQFIAIISQGYFMLIENPKYRFEKCDFADQIITQQVIVRSGDEDYFLTYRVSITGSKLGIEAAVLDVPSTPGIV